MILTCLRRAALAAVLASAGLISAGAPAWTAISFATPEEALQAFRAAVDSEGGKGLLDLFGKEHEPT